MLNNQQFQENVNKKLQKGTLLPTIETFLLLWYFLGPTWNSHKHKYKKKGFLQYLPENPGDAGQDHYEPTAQYVPSSEQQGCPAPDECGHDL